ncbi:hypothetical protein DFH07DRAFT_832518 [Mycena maculata]|uniref:F-box domain-containing protein n=1 Tax=Mycena maculata TaxID=230809 RepID=A0AAD7IPN2_9AGAR|nr:hypothetical protein DFH07DRAFT_832518 [Mycena maculata]
MYRLIPQIIRPSLDISRSCFPVLRQVSSVSFEDDMAHVPPEIWDLILRELDNDSLFTAGCVCRAFNSRSTTIYLDRMAISSELLAAGVLDIESHCLPALLLPASTPQLKTLVCRFTAIDDIARDLHRLRRFLANSHSIEELRLSFPHEDDMTQDPRSPEAQYSREMLVGELSHISREMAGKTAGPVFILPTPHVYMIGNWGTFRRGGFPGWFGFRMYTEEEEEQVGVIGASRLVWGPLWSRRYAPCYSAANPTSVLFRRISAASGAPRPFTLIGFDMDSMWWFQLGRQNNVDVPPWEVSPSEVEAVIPHITLPNLAHLEIQERMDPTTLGAFFRRHPHITSVADGASHAFMLLDAPVTLPRLTEISCTNIERLEHLLDALDRSPQLARISIPFQRDTPGAVAALTDALRRLCTSSLSVPTCLVLNLVESESFEALPSDIAGRLHGVDWVHVRCVTLAAARALVPWIAMFPTLQRLDLEIEEAQRRSGHASSRAGSAFLRETRAALARVPNVSLIFD